MNEALCDAIGLIDREPLTEAQTQVLDEQEHSVGTGRLGTLPEEITLKELAERLAAALPATAGGLRIAGRADQPIRRVALCGGAGDSLFDAVRATDAQVYITADLRHHPASEFRETARVDGSNIALIDCSHAASESLWLQSAANRLRALLAERGFAYRNEAVRTEHRPVGLHRLHRRGNRSGRALGKHRRSPRMGTLGREF